MLMEKVRRSPHPALYEKVLLTAAAMFTSSAWRCLADRTRGELRVERKQPQPPKPSQFTLFRVRKLPTRRDRVLVHLRPLVTRADYKKVFNADTCHPCRHFLDHCC